MGLDVVSYRMRLCLYSLDLLHTVPIGVQIGPAVCSSFIHCALPLSSLIVTIHYFLIGFIHIFIFFIYFSTNPIQWQLLKTVLKATQLDLFNSETNCYLPCLSLHNPTSEIQAYYLGRK